MLMESASGRQHALAPRPRADLATVMVGGLAELPEGAAFNVAPESGFQLAEASLYHYKVRAYDPSTRTTVVSSG